MPSSADLRMGGIKVAASKGKEKANPVREAMEKFATAGAGLEIEDQQGSVRDEASSSLVQMGCRLPALPKKLIERLRRVNMWTSQNSHRRKGRAGQCPRHLMGKLLSFKLLTWSRPGG